MIAWENHSLRLLFFLKRKNSFILAMLRPRLAMPGVWFQVSPNQNRMTGLKIRLQRPPMGEARP